MKKIFLLIFLAVAGRVHAQQFVNGFQFALPDSISDAKVEWADLDNDGLLDVLLIANVDTDVYLMTFKSDTTLGLLYQSAINTHYQSAAFHLNDYDLDNDIDVILSGSLSGTDQTTVWVNESFTFQSEQLLDNSGQVVMLADLDSDGGNELIVANDVIRIYKKSGALWSLTNDSIDVEVTALKVFDIDGDSDNDLFVSGTSSAGQKISRAYFNEGRFYFRAHGFSVSIAGHLSIGDLNHDGNFDVVISGKDNSDNSMTRLLVNRLDSFLVKDSISQFVDASVFPADFNSDGKCDLQFFGKNGSGDLVNKISFSLAGEVTLPSINVKDQKFGDFDKDGDLDLIQVVQEASNLVLVHSENTIAIENKGPGVPQNPVGFQLYDRAFLYWDKANDDHTVSSSLTYDLTVQTSMQEQMIGSFDLINNKRLTVSHGNTGTRNFAFVKNISGDVQFIVQAIDNSFHPSEGGVCNGGGMPFCTELVPEIIEVCRQQQVILTADAGAMWFSFKDGLIAQGPRLTIDVAAGDTIFAFTPNTAEGCAIVKLFSIELGSGIISETTQTRFACENQLINFEVEPAWTQVTWSSDLEGFLSNGQRIEYTVTKADTVTVLLSDGSGCFVQRNYVIKISKPELELSAEVYQILKGQSVQLSASGAETYVWSPSTELDNPQSAQPIATPLSTTSYQVTASDSIGCTVDGTVTVIVEGTAFIPNLFTPNSDGRNDEVKIYGLTSAKNFRFTIHNREGSTVYDTNDVQQATTTGWNGSARGSNLPSGVYYWKVKGEHPSGNKLLLNGKTSGSIVLIR